MPIAEMKGYLLLVGAIALGACTSTKATPDDPAAPTSTVRVEPAPKTAPVAISDERKPPMPITSAALALGDVNLGKEVGEPCDERSAAHCGTAKRIAFAVKHVAYNFTPEDRKRIELPCKEERLERSQDHMMARSGCETQGRVYIKNQCVACRMPSMTIGVAVVAEMTEPQLEAAQKLAGLSPQPLLRTASDWQSAFRTRAAPNVQN